MNLDDLRKAKNLAFQLIKYIGSAQRRDGVVGLVKSDDMDYIVETIAEIVQIIEPMSDECIELKEKI